MNNSTMEIPSSILENNQVESPMRFTPKEMSKCQDMLFSIPLYQRLFEWGTDEVEQLLNDLKTSFKKDKSKPYYIGMLTTVKQFNSFDLVDGQQRFIVLMLLGISFKWENFTKQDNHIRLTFFARKSDEMYLADLIDLRNSGEYTNKKMKTALTCINKFVENLSNEKEDFIKYAYENLTFFISFLPKNYKTQDLNRYFEAMNATGRGLENHEILKVELLKKLDTNKEPYNNKELYTKIWNSVSDIDRLLIRQKSDKENVEEFRFRQKGSLLKLKTSDDLNLCYTKFCNDGAKGFNDGTVLDTIRNIKPVTESPERIIRATGEITILSFSDFLLLVLGIQIGNEKVKSTPEFYDSHHLLDRFKATILKDEKGIEISKFFNNLLKYKVLLDYFVIRIGNNNDSSSVYTMQFKEDDEETNIRKKLIQYQSMLYVSTSYYLWLTDFLKFLENDPYENKIENIYNWLINFDNDRKSNSKEIVLTYDKIDRYWFWRLDYYLWERELVKETADTEKAILEYTFKKNRSIEHLHPQNPINEYDSWEKEYLDNFGNLALISTSFNSTQSHDFDEVKFTRIEMQKMRRYPLESVKMLYMYEKAKKDIKLWTNEIAIEHGDEMILILRDSFPETEEYKDIRQSLFNQLSLDKQNELKAEFENHNSELEENV